MQVNPAEHTLSQFPPQFETQDYSTQYLALAPSKSTSIPEKFSAAVAVLTSAGGAFSDRVHMDTVGNNFSAAI
jgi:hypothetical protein